MRKLFVAVALAGCTAAAAGLGAAEIKIPSAADNVGPVGTYQVVSAGGANAWVVDTRSGPVKFCAAANSPQESPSCSGFAR
jgi:hypothetical protein